MGIKKAEDPAIVGMKKAEDPAVVGMKKVVNPTIVGTKKVRGEIRISPLFWYNYCALVFVKLNYEIYYNSEDLYNRYINKKACKNASIMQNICGLWYIGDVNKYLFELVM